MTLKPSDIGELQMADLTEEEFDRLCETVKNLPESRRGEFLTKSSTLDHEKWEKNRSDDLSKAMDIARLEIPLDRTRKNIEMFDGIVSAAEQILSLEHMTYDDAILVCCSAFYEMMFDLDDCDPESIAGKKLMVLCYAIAAFKLKYEAENIRTFDVEEMIGGEFGS